MVGRLQETPTTEKGKAKLVFPTYGVHNPPEYSPCANADGVYPRGPDEPSDPKFPEYFCASWTMYRVYNNFETNLPPYKDKPPSPLVEGQDYEVSYGKTFYDSTYRGPNGEEGAMMEQYIDRALPIFAWENHYSCSFISLGNTAYFLSDDAPENVQSLFPGGICIFSDLNHPPKRDFIKHLPYSKTDSEQVGDIQAYSFYASTEKNESPFQTGASPYPKKPGILFGYSFHSTPTSDSTNPSAPSYKRPHSFYFGGVPTDPPNAPIVVQYYTEFSATKPDPSTTWDLVAQKSQGETPPMVDLYNLKVVDDGDVKCCSIL